MEFDRTKVAGLVLSAAALIGLATHENYVPVAVAPVAGDVATYGFGTTRHADGTPVRLGERITPVASLKRLGEDIKKYEDAVKRCAPVPMYQYEFDAYVSLTYNIGEGAFCNSTLAKKLNANDYEGACKEILKWDKFRGKPLAGLTARRQDEYKTCIGQ